MKKKINMAAKTIQKSWNNGKLIVLICLIESLCKVIVAAIELSFGHFKNTSPNETRGKKNLCI